MSINTLKILKFRNWLGYVLEQSRVFTLLLKNWLWLQLRTQIWISRTWDSLFFHLPNYKCLTSGVNVRIWFIATFDFYVFPKRSHQVFLHKKLWVIPWFTSLVVKLVCFCADGPKIPTESVSSVIFAIDQHFCKLTEPISLVIYAIDQRFC